MSFGKNNLFDFIPTTNLSIQINKYIGICNFRYELYYTSFLI